MKFISSYILILFVIVGLSSGKNNNAQKTTDETDEILVANIYEGKEINSEFDVKIDSPNCSNDP